MEVGQNKDLFCYRKSSHSGSVPENSVLKPDFRPKGRALGIRKSQKISTASDQYFLSYVKQTIGEGGGQNDPPPAEIGLNHVQCKLNCYVQSDP